MYKVINEGNTESNFDTTLWYNYVMNFADDCTHTMSLIDDSCSRNNMEQLGIDY